MILTIWMTTMTGRKEANEDRALCNEVVLSHGHLAMRVTAPAVAAVFDGVSTGGEGGIAAQVAAEAFSRVLPSIGQDAATAIGTACEEAHGRLASMKESYRINSYASTTASGIAIMGNDEVTLFNCGDSRVYRHRSGIVSQLTEDDTVVRDMRDAGAPEAVLREAKESNPHTITRALGAGSPSHHPVTVKAGGICVPRDMFVICSDGLHDALSDEEIAETLDGRPPHPARALATRAYEAGSRDNISVVVIEAGG